MKPLASLRSTLRVAVVQTAVDLASPADVDPVDALVPHLRRASEDGADLVVFPEYTLGDTQVSGPRLEKLLAAAREARVNLIVGAWERLPGHPIEHPPRRKTYANAALVVSREGHLVGIHRKVHAAVGSHSPYFWPPDADELGEDAMVAGERPSVFDLDCGRIGVLTCYDGYFFPSFEIPSLRGAEVLVWVNSRGSPVEDFIVRTASFLTCTHVVASNHPSGGGSTICSYPGTIDAVAKSGEAFISHTLDLAGLRVRRRNDRMLHQRRPEAYGDLVLGTRPWEAYPEIPAYAPPLPAPAAGLGQVRVRVVDAATEAPLACHIELRDVEGKPVRSDPRPFFAGQVACGGEAVFAVPPGTVSYSVERGPEWTRYEGLAHARAGETEEAFVKLRRIVDLPREGWWAGDLHVHRATADMGVLMRAADLHMAPVITWWNRTNPWKDRPAPPPSLQVHDGNRSSPMLAGEDERLGGAFLFFGLERPLDIASAGPEHPSPIAFLEEARWRGAWIEIEKPFWWDVPVALALGLGDSIGIAHNHLWRGGGLDDEAWGRPRDRGRFPPPRGNGLWSLEIYHHALNAGLRIPPSAGSASGVLPNPVGYDRVYVQLPGPFSHDAWWEGLRAGRCFVTNGPLLRARAGGELPGHVFRSPGPLEVSIDVRIDGTDPIEAVEIVRDGEVLTRIPGEELSPAGRVGTVRLEQSGWFLVRALTSVENTFRFAMTGPFYVEVGGEASTVHRRSVRFFIEWIRERMDAIALEDPGRRADVLRYQAEALRIWERRLAEATAE